MNDCKNYLPCDCSISGDRHCKKCLKLESEHQPSPSPHSEGLKALVYKVTKWKQREQVHVKKISTPPMETYWGNGYIQACIDVLKELKTPASDSTAVILSAPQDQEKLIAETLQKLENHLLGSALFPDDADLWQVNGNRETVETILRDAFRKALK